MLQNREQATSELEKAKSAESDKIAEKLAKLRDSKDLKPKDKNNLREDLLDQKLRLFGSDAFLQDLWRFQYRGHFLEPLSLRRRPP